MMKELLDQMMKLEMELKEVKEPDTIRKIRELKEFADNVIDQGILPGIVTHNYCRETSSLARSKPFLQG